MQDENTTKRGGVSSLFFFASLHDTFIRKQVLLNNVFSFFLFLLSRGPRDLFFYLYIFDIINHTHTEH